MEAITLDALTALEPLPSEEELLASNTVRDFVAEKILPLIGEHFERHTFPDELNSEVGELGLFGAAIEGYGFAGVNSVTYGLLPQKLQDVSVGLMLN